MKKIFFLATILATSLIFGQNTFPPDGNVGIGTTSPSNKLHIIGNALKIAISENANNIGYYALLQAFHAPDTGLLSFVGAGGGGKVIGGSNYGTDTSIYSNTTEKIRILNSGNVGIGINTPNAKLQVNGDISSSGIDQRIGFNTDDKFTNTSGTIAHYGMSISKDPGDIRIVSHSGFFGLNFYTNGAEKMRILQNGNVGIGISSPNAKLQINGDISSSGIDQRIGFNTDDKFTNTSGTIAHYGMSISKDPNNFLIVSHSGFFGLNFYTNGAEKMRILQNGNIGIGTTSPDSKLTVKGKIHAEEVKVDLAVPADYVFEKYYLGKSSLKPDYTLLTLSAVEKFTKENHHLPNVPSAKEIKENGLLLGEMSNILLQKIEELTLYSIDQQKKIEKLEKENESFKKLEERLATIEKLLDTKKQ
jgi:hypothetical protein